ncbi:MAG: hypothetical protein CMR00_08335 [[Chlorobium] sp. 445]|nr:MAG: hypothetical protein CMR00_08335 [[Chlorobium] sp. 445]
MAPPDLSNIKRVCSMSKTLAYSNDSQVIDFLSRVSPFERLTTDELQAVANLLWRQHFAEGEKVFSQGDHSSEAYIIESGKLSFEKMGHIIRFLKQAKYVVALPW